MSGGLLILVIFVLLVCLGVVLTGKNAGEYKGSKKPNSIWFLLEVVVILLFTAIMFAISMYSKS